MFWPKFSYILFFLNPKFFGPTRFWSLDLLFLGPIIFKDFKGTKIFGPKFVWIQNCCAKQILEHKILQGLMFFLTKNFLDPTFSLDQHLYGLKSFSFVLYLVWFNLNIKTIFMGFDSNFYKEICKNQILIVIILMIPHLANEESKISYFEWLLTSNCLQSPASSQAHSRSLRISLTIINHTCHVLLDNVCCTNLAARKIKHNKYVKQR